MVGNSLTSQAYRLYDREKRIVVEKRGVLYIEGNFDDTSAETTTTKDEIRAELSI